MSHDCAHPRKRLVWSDISAYDTPLKSRQLRLQCLDCGWLLGEHQPHRDARPETPNVDRVALRRCNERREADWNKRYRSVQEEREKENAEWRARYDEHLASEKWRRMRELIFARDGGVCRGCLRRPATQVHHTTYTNVCNEFAFELIAVCEICHRKIHGKAS